MQFYRDKGASWSASRNNLLWSNQKENKTNKGLTALICNSGEAMKNCRGKGSVCIIQIVLIQFFLG